MVYSGGRREEGNDGNGKGRCNGKGQRQGAEIRGVGSGDTSKFG